MANTSQHWHFTWLKLTEISHFSRRNPKTICTAWTQWRRKILKLTNTRQSVAKQQTSNHNLILCVSPVISYLWRAESKTKSNEPRQGRNCNGRTPDSRWSTLGYILTFSSLKNRSSWGEITFCRLWNRLSLGAVTFSRLWKRSSWCDYAVNWTLNSKTFLLRLPFIFKVFSHMCY